METLNITRAPSVLKGEIRLPSSKSISNRALMIRALSGNYFPIYNMSVADDTLLMDAIFSSDEKEMYVKNAGTAMRFLTAYFATSEGEFVLRGDERMNQRPIADLVDALRQLGADIEYTGQEGYPPLRIRGRRLKGGQIKVKADVSSQYVSALLMIAPTLPQGLSVQMQGQIVSEPYIELTLQMLNYFGVEWERKDNTIHVPHQPYRAKDFFVENDWSAASYFWALAAVFPGSELYFPNLSEDSWQGDSYVKHLMQDFGIGCHFHKSGCTIYSSGIKARSFNRLLSGYPDLVPTFVSLGCAVGMRYQINGTANLQHKESDRSGVLVEELTKLGFGVKKEDDEIRYKPINTCRLDDVTLLTHNDHRMAMSWAILAAKNPHIFIENPDCVQKSFPHFWTEMENLGFQIVKHT